MIFDISTEELIEQNKHVNLRNEYGGIENIDIALEEAGDRLTDSTTIVIMEATTALDVIRPNVADGDNIGKDTDSKGLKKLAEKIITAIKQFVINIGKFFAMVGAKILDMLKIEDKLLTKLLAKAKTHQAHDHDTKDFGEGAQGARHRSRPTINKAINPDYKRVVTSTNYLFSITMPELKGLLKQLTQMFGTGAMNRVATYGISNGLNDKKTASNGYTNEKLARDAFSRLGTRVKEYMANEPTGEIKVFLDDKKTDIEDFTTDIAVDFREISKANDKQTVSTLSLFLSNMVRLMGKGIKTKVTNQIARDLAKSIADMNNIYRQAIIQPRFMMLTALKECRVTLEEYVDAGYPVTPYVAGVQLAYRTLNYKK